MNEGILTYIMSAIVKTEAVVLRSIKYRESSKIVTFYTREFGKVKAVAKGARQIKSKFGSSLEPMSYVSLVLYKKEHRDLQLVSQCDLIKFLHDLYDDLDKLVVGMFIIELVDKVSHDEEKNQHLFHLLMEALRVLSAATKNHKNLLYGFEIRLAGILGFRPQFGLCIQCGKRLVQENGGSVVFNVGKGGPLCPSHADTDGVKVNVNRLSFHILSRLAGEGDLEEIFLINIDEDQCTEIESLLLGYLRYHVDGLHNLKSVKVLSRILA